MVAPLVGGAIRIGGGLVLRRVSMGNALTGIGMGIRLGDYFQDDNGNTYVAEAENFDRRGRSRSNKIRVPRKVKRTRKVSPYQKEFGRQLKKLKKAHPRTDISVLMKKAHRATKKARK